MSDTFTLNEDETIVVASTLQITIMSIEERIRRNMYVDKDMEEAYEKCKKLLSKIEEDFF